MTDLLVLRDVEVGGSRVDVVVETGTVIDVVPPGSAPPASHTIDGGGGALLPGLWDHHVHLLATAASLASTRAGPPVVTEEDELVAALRRADRQLPAGAWIRAVGYHDSVAGPLNRVALDRAVPHRPVRLQHRSGALWVLNSSASRILELDRSDHPGIERDASGRATGRLYGADDWLRVRVPQITPDIGRVGRMLAEYGVTGVTDATPYEDLEPMHLLADAHDRGLLPQRVVVTGGPVLADVALPGALERGPVKLLYQDHALPGLDQVIADVRTARAAGRTVAVHCVTRAGLVLALSALDVVGPRPGDRIEHGAVIPDDLLEWLRRLGVTVVTQQNFLAERGDEYLAEVDVADLPHLYPCARLIGGEIPVGGSTDAPFGDPDPWRSIAAATRRRSSSGRRVGEDRGLPGRAALALFTGPPRSPGGATRRVVPGTRADLCLLDAPLTEVLREPSAAHVRATLIGGRTAYERP